METMEACCDGIYHLIQIVEDAIAHIIFANALPHMLGRIQFRAVRRQDSSFMLAGTVSSWALCHPAPSRIMTQYSSGNRVAVWARKRLIKGASTQGRTIDDIWPSWGQTAA